MRRLTYLLMIPIWISAVSCKDDDVTTPPKPFFQVDKLNAEVDDTVRFTVYHVQASAISLLPYGLPGGDAGVLLNNFKEGVTTVDFMYKKPGTFQAIVVANNHSGDGERIKNVHSEPITIIISSSKNAMLEFGFSKVDAKTEINESTKTITVTVPYGTDISKLKAIYKASGFTTVTIGGVEQKSGETENDFSSDVIYTVTSNTGIPSNYTVKVNRSTVEKINTIKAITVKSAKKSANQKVLPAFVDNTTRKIVIYDTLGTPSSQFDSLRIGYALDGKFAILKYGGKIMKQDSLLTLTSPKEFILYPQDSAMSGTIAYSVYAVAAPKLTLSFPELNPNPGLTKKPTNFTLDIQVLRGTNLSAIKTIPMVMLPSGATVKSYKVNGNGFTEGSAVNYNEPVTFEVVVKDDAIDAEYSVRYTVSITYVP